MAILLFGATGMLGQALAREASRRGRALVGASRLGPDLEVDLAHIASLRPLFDAVEPTLVVNAAALTGLGECERDAARAYAVNARAVALMGEAAAACGVPLVQVSTDHFFTGDRDRLHDEDAPVALVNEYARTKFAGEAFALAAPGALVLRTNIAGLRGWPQQPSFAEWAIDALARRRPLTLFEDYFTSTLDAPSFAAALFDLADRRTAGLVNLAARGAASKRAFLHALAGALGIALDWDAPGRVADLAPRRAESLGLAVGKAEALLGRALPGLEQVCRNLVVQWEEQRCAMQPA